MVDGTAIHFVFHTVYMVTMCVNSSVAKDNFTNGFDKVTLTMVPTGSHVNVRVARGLLGRLCAA